MTLKDAIIFRIGQLCEMKNLTAYALAISCGIDKSTIYSILSDKSKSPEVATIKKICDGLEITLGQFFSTPEFDKLNRRLSRQAPVFSIRKGRHDAALSLYT